MEAAAERLPGEAAGEGSSAGAWSEAISSTRRLLEESKRQIEYLRQQHSQLASTNETHAARQVLGRPSRVSGGGLAPGAVAATPAAAAAGGGAGGTSPRGPRSSGGSQGGARGAAARPAAARLATPSSSPPSSARSLGSGLRAGSAGSRKVGTSLATGTSQPSSQKGAAAVAAAPAAKGARPKIGARPAPSAEAPRSQAVRLRPAGVAAGAAQPEVVAVVYGGSRGAVTSDHRADGAFAEIAATIYAGSQVDGGRAAGDGRSALDSRSVRMFSGGSSASDGRRDRLFSEDLAPSSVRTPRTPENPADWRSGSAVLVGVATGDPGAAGGASLESYASSSACADGATSAIIGHGTSVSLPATAILSAVPPLPTLPAVRVWSASAVAGPAVLSTPHTVVTVQAVQRPMGLPSSPLAQVSVTRAVSHTTTAWIPTAAPCAGEAPAAWAAAVPRPPSPLQLRLPADEGAAAEELLAALRCGSSAGGSAVGGLGQGSLPQIRPELLNHLQLVLEERKKQHVRLEAAEAKISQLERRNADLAVENCRLRGTALPGPLAWSPRLAAEPTANRGASVSIAAGEPVVRTGWSLRVPIAAAVAPVAAAPSAAALGSVSAASAALTSAAVSRCISEAPTAAVLPASAGSIPAVTPPGSRLVLRARSESPGAGVVWGTATEPTVTVSAARGPLLVGQFTNPLTMRSLSSPSSPLMTARALGTAGILASPLMPFRVLRQTNPTGLDREVTHSSAGSYPAAGLGTLGPRPRPATPLTAPVVAQIGPRCPAVPPPAVRQPPA